MNTNGMPDCQPQVLCYEVAILFELKIMVLVDALPYRPQQI